MNDEHEYLLLFTEQSSVYSNIIADNLLENILRLECFVLVGLTAGSHKTNLFSSDIGSDDDAQTSLTSIQSTDKC